MENELALAIPAKHSYHRTKLAFTRDGTLDAKRIGDTKFAKVADFLELIPTTCPHDLFRDSERASQSADFIDASRLIVVEKENFATRMAALVIPAIGNNRLRHEALQRFMLANDLTTLAVEIPIWLPPSEILELEREHGILLRSPNASPGACITGHIDFFQVRHGAVLVPGLNLFDIKCAWFNEQQYCEFFPRTLLSARSAQPR